MKVMRTRVALAHHGHNDEEFRYQNSHEFCYRYSLPLIRRKQAAEPFDFRFQLGRPAFRLSRLAPRELELLLLLA